jgi:hypothetical protein
VGLRAAVDELLSILEALAPSLESKPDQVPRQFAAAGLMRCCALLRGICVLEDAGLGPVTGILERQHWETWLVSLHVLFRGDEALQEVGGDDIFWKRLLSKKLDLGLSYHEDWEGKIASLDFKRLAEGLKPLLVAAGEPGDPDGVLGYDVTYRVQSLFAVHAGLATIGSYIRSGDETWGVIPHPPAPFPRPTQTPALHTVHLAGYVLKAFGLGNDRLERIWDTLVRGVGDPHVM